MKRRIALLTATLLAAGTFVVASAPPASAWVVCQAAGAMFITNIGNGAGMLYPVTANIPSKLPGLIFDILIGDLLFRNPTYRFTISLPIGTCVHPPGMDTTKVIRGSGIVKGYCGLASGRGILDNGDLFAFLVIGKKMFVTGHLLGELFIAPNAAAGETCVHVGVKAALPGAGALAFVVAGSIVLLNCSANLETLVPGTPNDTEVLVPLVTTEHLNALFHVKVNTGLHFFWNHQCVGNPIL